MRQMAWAVLGISAIALAGCGGDGSVMIERSPQVVQQTIGNVDGKIPLEGMLTSPPVIRTTDGNVTSYLIKGRGGNPDSHIVLTVEPADNGFAKLSMAVDIAPIEHTMEGQQKFLNEGLVANALRAQLRGMERQLENGAPPSTAAEGLDRAIAFTALATDPAQVDRALVMAKDGGLEDTMRWNEGGPSRWGDGSEAMDRAEFTEVEGTRPEAQFVTGTKPSGASPDPMDGGW